MVGKDLKRSEKVIVVVVVVQILSVSVLLSSISVEIV